MFYLILSQSRKCGFYSAAFCKKTLFRKLHYLYQSTLNKVMAAGVLIF